MKKDLTILRKLAEDASTGPWEFIEGDGAFGVSTPVGSLTWDDHGGEVFKEEDAKFISAFNPSVAIYLIDRIRIAEDQRDRVTADRNRCQDLNRNLVDQLADVRYEKTRSMLSSDIYAHENSRLRSKIKMLENIISDVGFVVDNLHATSTIDQDTADQLTDAIEGKSTT